MIELTLINNQYTPKRGTYRIVAAVTVPCQGPHTITHLVGSSKHKYWQGYCLKNEFKKISKFRQIINKTNTLNGLYSPYFNLTSFVHSTQDKYTMLTYLLPVMPYSTRMNIGCYWVNWNWTKQDFFMRAK